MFVLIFLSISLCRTLCEDKKLDFDIMKLYGNSKRNEISVVEKSNVTSDAKELNKVVLNQTMLKKIDPKSNDTSYGSMRFPAKSCQDLALKGLIKNEPEVFYIKAVDDEVLQVFCPQTFTYSKPELSDGVSYTVNGTSSPLNVSNSSLALPLDIKMNQSLNFSNTTSENNTSLRPEKVNQTATHDAIKHSETVPTKEVDPEAASMKDMTEKMEKSREADENATLRVNPLTPRNETNQVTNDKLEKENNRGAFISLIGKDSIFKNLKRSFINKKKAKKENTKPRTTKDKMKIPLYTSINNLLKQNSIKKGGETKNDKNKVSSSEADEKGSKTKKISKGKKGSEKKLNKEKVNEE